MHSIDRPRRLTASIVTTSRLDSPARLVRMFGLQLLHRQADVEIHQCLALHLFGPQAPGVLVPTIPGADLQFAVEHGDAEAQAAQDGVRVAPPLGDLLATARAAPRWLLAAPRWWS